MSFPSLEWVAGRVGAARVSGLDARWAAHGPRLTDVLARLYGTRADFVAARRAIFDVLARACVARPAALADLDEARAADPAWFRSSTQLGYSAYADRFAGSLAGVGDRIAHLSSLGVTYLHLLPFWRRRAGENDGGFAVSDFRAVEPALGWTEDLPALAARLRTAGISLCADFVLNHTADDHAWARAARAGDAAFRDFYHVFPDRTLPDAYEMTLREVFPTTAPGNFTFVEDAGGWVWTTFHGYQWDLNYRNPAVLAAMLETLLDLANAGVEAFRLDSAAYLWKRLGTICMGLPEAHLVLRAFRAAVDIVAPGVLLKAEAIIPASDLPPFLGLPDEPGGECHLAYHAGLMTAAWAAVAEQSTALLDATIDATPALDAAGSWVTYVRCHDDIGWHVLRGIASPERLDTVARFYDAASGGWALGAPFQPDATGDAPPATNGMTASLLGLESADPAERRAAADRIVLLHALAFCFGGLPLLYMGDEIGLRNDRGYAADPARAADGRWLQRPAMDWSAPVIQGLRRLAAARRALPALAAGAPARRIPLDGAVLALARERFRGLLNFSDRARRVTLPDIEAPDVARDVLGGPGPANGAVTVPAWGTVWLAWAA